MTVAVFIFSLLGAMAIGMPIAFALIICGVALMAYLGIFDSQIIAQNVKLLMPEPHFLELLKGAARHQALANIYSDGFNHPGRFWATVSSSERTAALLAQFRDEEIAAL